MEDIGLPTRCKGSLGYGEDMIHQNRPNHMAEVGPVEPDGKEIPVCLVYDQVELAAKYSQQDCRLDSLLDSIEEEVCGSK